MKPYFFFIPLVALASALSLTPSAHAQNATDIVPRTDVAYAFLGSLAGRGRLPGYTLADFVRGDRLYTRAEIARFIEHLLPQDIEHLQPHDMELRSFMAMERVLRERFAPELHADDPASFALDPRVPATSTPGGSLWVKARGESNPSAFSLIGNLTAVEPFGRDGYATVSLGNPREEWYPTHGLDGSGRYGYIENAYAYVGGRVMNLTVGQMPVRWGPGYSGALLIGDEGPSIPQIKLDKTFLLPGSFGEHVGRIRFEEFTGEFYEHDIADAQPGATGTRRFLTGKRLVFAGGPWSFEVGEAMKSARLPDPEWALILPLGIYQNEWTKGSRTHLVPFLPTTREPNTYWKNYQGHGGVTYTVNRQTGLNIYSDLLIDDIKAVKGLGTGNDTPQKLGEQIGVAAPHLGGENGRFGARVEYTSIDADTYTNVSTPVNWTINGAPLGYTAGPNARVFFGRVDATLTDKIKVAVEGATRRPKGTSIPGYASINSDRAGVYATYAFKPYAFTGLRVEHGRFDDFNLANTSTTQTRFEANIGFGL